MNALGSTPSHSLPKFIHLLALSMFVLVSALTFSNRSAHAMDIEVVKSPGGIEAWLVRETSVPLVAMRFSFDGGSSQDPDGKEGLANFLSVMLDEGAGDLDAQTFQRRLEELAVRLSFSDGRDTFTVSMQTLSKNLDRATDLLKLALTKPTFGEKAVTRMRSYLLTRLAAAQKNPNQIVAKTWSATAFPGHPYGRPSGGTLESVAAITSADLEAYRKRVFARDTLKIAVVGDIDAKTLGPLLDKLFGDLAATANLNPVPEIAPVTGGVNKVVTFPVPQSVAIFGMGSISRTDRDFIPAFVMNHILGGGGFSSKLMQEVREKRGLAYSVYSYLQPFDRSSIFAGGVATKNDKIGESLTIIREQFQQMADNGPDPADLKAAIQYLTGSYALRFDTNSKVAQQLLGILQDELGLDYIKERNDLIRAVTAEDVKRAADRIIKTDDLIVTVVGNPVGWPG